MLVGGKAIQRPGAQKKQEAMDRIGYTWVIFGNRCFHVQEGLGEAFSRISGCSVTKRDTKVDKNRCMVAKIGQFPNLIDTTGHTRGFCGQNRAYYCVDPSFKAHSR